MHAAIGGGTEAASHCQSLSKGRPRAPAPAAFTYFICVRRPAQTTANRAIKELEKLRDEYAIAPDQMPVKKYFISILRHLYQMYFVAQS